MRKDHFLTRNAGFFFAGFFLLALVAFWPGYYGRLGSEIGLPLHLHGVGLSMWCVLLVIQPFLIRYKKNNLHRKVGTFSYLLVPFIVYSTIHLIHYQMKGSPQVGLSHMYALALILNGIVAFVIIFSLAVYFRKDAAIHAQFMVCTVFTMISPVTDRIIYQFFRPVVSWVPRVGPIPVVPVAGFLLADLTLVFLILREWRAGRSVAPYAVSLGVVMIYHFSVLNFHKYQFWFSFAKWFVGVGN